MDKDYYKNNPLSTHTSNSPGVPWFTCPACYTVMPNAIEGTNTCPECGTEVHCEIHTELVYEASIKE